MNASEKLSSSDIGAAISCDKSTILNKIAEELKTEYHVVVFSAGDADILPATYLQVLESVKLSMKILVRFPILG